MSSSLILTHADLDGMVSGILLLTKLGPDTRVRITNGIRIAEVIRAETANSHTIGAVYIADIPLDRVCIEDAYNVLSTLARQDCSLHLYDHHIGWNQASSARRFRALFATYDVDETKTTAAALVWRDFLRCDPRYGRWLELLSKKDGSPDGSVAEDFRLLVTLMQPMYSRRKTQTMHCLASGTEIPDRQEMLNWYSDEYLPRERQLAENADVFETNSGRRVGWIDLREEEYLYLDISKIVIDRHSVDLVASVIYSGVLIGGVSINKGIDLSFLHGCQSARGVDFEGIGHKSPVRFRPLDGQVSDQFVLAVRDFINQKL